MVKILVWDFPLWQTLGGSGAESSSCIPVVLTGDLR